MTRKILAFLLLSLSLSAAADQHIQEFRLPNGLKVVVQEDHRSPVVVSQVWYRVGSIDEFNGTTGVAHVLEHMMFKGTKAVPAGRFSRIVAAAGGKENAFTSHDYTVYFQQLEKSRLGLAMKLEADRMENLRLTTDEFSKEIQVVMEERRWRTEDKPQAQVGEQFMAVAHQVHPYGRPVIGWMNDLEHMTAEDARAWYRTWYAPNNATLVVVGDVDPRQVFKLAQQYFGSLKAHKLPQRKPQTEPEQKGERRVAVKAQAKLPYLAMGYPAPALRSAEEWEPYALEILAGVLDGNAASRLNRDLVRRDRIAVDIGAGYDMLNRGPSMFEFDGTPSEGATVQDLELAIRGEIDNLKENGVTEDELQRVKAQVIASDVYKRDSMFYQAMQIGQLESVGLSWRLLDEYPKRLQAVTAEQVQAVARKYLDDDKLTVATLDPQPLDENAPKHKEMPHVH
ncbi:M16 family metallopeptidase [Novimethylophilus sp.]|uniref:M16 family metallopeptidase n=1 Tax=Novimethylophilus sp. TaxID=2137426 RepID=UPI0039C90BEF